MAVIGRALEFAQIISDGKVGADEAPRALEIMKNVSIGFENRSRYGLSQHKVALADANEFIKNVNYRLMQMQSEVRNGSCDEIIKAPGCFSGGSRYELDPCLHRDDFFS